MPIEALHHMTGMKISVKEAAFVYKLDGSEHVFKDLLGWKRYLMKSMLVHLESH